MKNYPEHQITTSAKAADSCVNEADSPMPELIRLTLYESAHNSDGLLLHPPLDFAGLRALDIDSLRSQTAST